MANGQKTYVKVFRNQMFEVLGQGSFDFKKEKDAKTDNMVPESGDKRSNLSIRITAHKAELDSIMERYLQILLSRVAPNSEIFKALTGKKWGEARQAAAKKLETSPCKESDEKNAAYAHILFLLGEMRSGLERGNRASVRKAWDPIETLRLYERDPAYSKRIPAHIIEAAQMMRNDSKLASLVISIRITEGSY